MKQYFKLVKIFPLFVLAILASSFIYLSVENIINRPFPFLDVIYFEDSQLFNSAPAKFPINLKIPLKEINDAESVINQLKNIKNDKLYDKIKIATDYTRNLQSVSAGKQVRGIDDVFNKSSSYISVCSEASKIFSALMQASGIPSRVIWMYVHAVSEVWDGSKWIMVDVQGNIMAKNSDSEFVNLVEAIKNYDNLDFVRISDVTSSSLSDYTLDGYLQKNTNAYKQQGLAFVIDGPHLFSFHKDTKILENILLSVVDSKEERIGYGVQYLFIDSKKVGNAGVNIFRRFF